MLEQLGRLGVAAPREVNLVRVGVGVGVGVEVGVGVGVRVGVRGQWSVVGVRVGQGWSISCTFDAVTGSNMGRMSFHEAKKMLGAPTWTRGLTARLQPGYMGLQPGRIGLQPRLQRAAHQQRRPQTLRIVLLRRKKTDASSSSLGQAPGRRRSLASASTRRGACASWAQRAAALSSRTRLRSGGRR